MNLIKILPINKRRLDILFEIYSNNENYLRNISKNLEINPSITHKILNVLSTANTITKRSLGKEKLYSLNKNKDYDLIIKILEEYHLEKTIEKSKTLKTAINLIINNKKLIESSEKIYLFGSFLTQAQKKNDIDILFVSEHKKFITKTCREISLIINKTMNPLIYTKKKFEEDLRKKEPLITSITTKVKNRAIIK